RVGQDANPMRERAGRQKFLPQTPSFLPASLKEPRGKRDSPPFSGRLDFLITDCIMDISILV
ncbi:MAG: hypothetical protein WC806_05905, partial [Candidatus Gracilibacteria bacterium]